ncbi:MAG: VWA domain-containing protein, partial [Caldilineae bacterium]
MSFAQPLYLYLGAVLLPGMILFMVEVRRRRRHLSKRLGDPAFVQQLSGSRNPVAGFWRSVMWLLACAAVLLALARPRWGEDSRSTTQRGAQIIIGLDVSPSMLAADEAPTRLDRAKTAIREMIARSPGDQFGLVIFSGASFTLVPLTSDRDVLFTAVEQAGVDSISRRGTVLADAIYTAARGFNDEFPGQKAIVLFSDGEDTETKPLSAARYAAGRDILIYTVGLGSPQGAPIPLYDAKGNLTGFKEDAQGNVIHSAVNEALLRAIAEAGGGAYRHASGAAR